LADDNSLVNSLNIMYTKRVKHINNIIEQINIQSNKYTGHKNHLLNLLTQLDNSKNSILYELQIKHDTLTKELGNLLVQAQSTVLSDHK